MKLFQRQIDSHRSLDETDMMVLSRRCLEKEGLFPGETVLVATRPPHQRKEAVFTLGWKVMWEAESEQFTVTDRILAGSGAFDKLVKIFRLANPIHLSPLTKTREAVSAALLLETPKEGYDPISNCRIDKNVLQAIERWIQAKTALNFELCYRLDGGLRFAVVGDADWGCPKLPFHQVLQVRDFDRWYDLYTKYCGGKKEIDIGKLEYEADRVRYRKFSEEFYSKKDLSEKKIRSLLYMVEIKLCLEELAGKFRNHWDSIIQTICKHDRRLNELLKMKSDDKILLNEKEYSVEAVLAKVESAYCLNNVESMADAIQGDQGLNKMYDQDYKMLKEYGKIINSMKFPEYQPADIPALSEINIIDDEIDRIAEYKKDLAAEQERLKSIQRNANEVNQILKKHLKNVEATIAKKIIGRIKTDIKKFKNRLERLYGINEIEEPPWNFRAKEISKSLEELESIFNELITNLLLPCSDEIIKKIEKQIYRYLLGLIRAVKDADEWLNFESTMEDVSLAAEEEPQDYWA